MKGAIRVLLVEDDPVERRLLTLLLDRAADMEPLAAADGLEGLEAALRWHPDVILLELMLPGISGLELLRRYRSLGGKGAVLVLTRATGAAIERAALTAGADFFLTKPAHWGEVERLIRSLSGGLRRACEALLIQMGADFRWIGVRQAAHCAALLGEGKSLLLKEAYIDTAAREHCRVESVEKNVRSLIRRLHEAGHPAYRRLTAGLDNPSCPTNGTFLRLLAEKAAVGGDTDGAYEREQGLRKDETYE